MKSSPLTRFRPSAFARVRSPEQMDALLPLTSPRGWLVLLALVLALGATTLWAFFGTIVRTTRGEGTILRSFELGTEGTGARAEGEWRAQVYIPVAEGRKVTPGMKVLIAPATIRPEEDGYLLGEVAAVSRRPVTREVLLRKLGGSLRQAERLLADGSALQLEVKFQKDPATPGGFAWSLSRGPDLAIESGTPCRATIVLETLRPIALLVPSWGRALPPSR
ncbi:MAG TPA: hypothetical protein VNQ90_08920 [Chthoniobacteraceae bacterium]|nr:hypothetical protein [Chthoniobacteraceae bacterium]